MGQKGRDKTSTSVELGMRTGLGRPQTLQSAPLQSMELSINLNELILYIVHIVICLFTARLDVNQVPPLLYVRY